MAEYGLREEVRDATWESFGVFGSRMLARRVRHLLHMTAVDTLATGVPGSSFNASGTLRFTATVDPQLVSRRIIFHVY